MLGVIDVYNMLRFIEVDIILRITEAKCSIGVWERKVHSESVHVFADVLLCDNGEKTDR